MLLSLLLFGTLSAMDDEPQTLYVEPSGTIEPTYISVPTIKPPLPNEPAATSSMVDELNVGSTDRRNNQLHVGQMMILMMEINNNTSLISYIESLNCL